VVDEGKGLDGNKKEDKLCGNGVKDMFGVGNKETKRIKRS